MRIDRIRTAVLLAAAVAVLSPALMRAADSSVVDPDRVAVSRDASAGELPAAIEQAMQLAHHHHHHHHHKTGVKK